MKMEVYNMLQMLSDCLNSKLVINILLLGIAGGLYRMAKKLKAN